jgi:hypothetical protein
MILPAGLATGLFKVLGVNVDPGLDVDIACRLLAGVRKSAFGWESRSSSSLSASFESSKSSSVSSSSIASSS